MSGNNNWADPFSRFEGTSVEWYLKPTVFESLTFHYGPPEDQFGSRNMAQLAHYLIYDHRTKEGA